MDVNISGFDKPVLITAFDKLGDVKVLLVKGEKGDIGDPTAEQVQNAVNTWLTAHPEATTTVQDGAVTPAKLSETYLAIDSDGLFYVNVEE